MKREYSAEVELLNLLEKNAVPLSATTLTTPLTDAQLITSANHSPMPSTSLSGRFHGDYAPYSPVISSCNSSHHVEETAAKAQRRFSAGSLDEVDYYGSLPRSLGNRNALSLAATDLNHARPAKKILKKSRVLNGGKFLLAERNIGYILGSLSLLGKSIKLEGLY